LGGKGESAKPIRIKGSEKKDVVRSREEKWKPAPEYAKRSKTKVGKFRRESN